MASPQSPSLPRSEPQHTFFCSVPALGASPALRSSWGAMAPEGPPHSLLGTPVPHLLPGTEPALCMRQPKRNGWMQIEEEDAGLGDWGQQ